MSIFGIDVSEYQGRVDWSRMKKAGVRSAMLRAGFGAGEIDAQFRNNAEGCARESIPFGVYWFSYACTPRMARREARLCLETIEDFKVEYPVCIAFGEESVQYAAAKGITVTEELAAAIVKAFCDKAREMGYTAMYYSNPAGCSLKNSYTFS